MTILPLVVWQSSFSLISYMVKLYSPETMVFFGQVMSPRHSGQMSQNQFWVSGCLPIYSFQIVFILHSKCLKLFYVWPAVPNGDEVLSGLEALQAQGVVSSSPTYTAGCSINRVAFTLLQIGFGFGFGQYPKLNCFSFQLSRRESVDSSKCDTVTLSH